MTRIERTDMLTDPHLDPDRMHAVLDREASVEEEERALQHLAACELCREAYSGWLLPELLGDVATPRIRIGWGGRLRAVGALAAAKVIAAAACLTLAAVSLQSASNSAHDSGRDSAAETFEAKLLAVEVVRERTGPTSMEREVWTLKPDGSVEAQAKEEHYDPGVISATVTRTTRKIEPQSLAAVSGVVRAD